MTGRTSKREFGVTRVIIPAKAFVYEVEYLTIILPLLTEIEKNDCFSIYTGSDVNNIFRRKPLKIDSETLAKHEFTPTILFLFGLRIIHSVGGE